MPGEWPPERILALRAKLGWNQTVFAMRLETDAPTISRWENGLRAPKKIHRRELDRLEMEVGRGAAAGTGR